MALDPQILIFGLTAWFDIFVGFSYQRWVSQTFFFLVLVLIDQNPQLHSLFFCDFHSGCNLDKFGLKRGHLLLQLMILRVELFVVVEGLAREDSLIGTFYSIWPSLFGVVRGNYLTIDGSSLHVVPWSKAIKIFDGEAFVTLMHFY